MAPSGACRAGPRRRPSERCSRKLRSRSKVPLLRPPPGERSDPTYGSSRPHTGSSGFSAGEALVKSGAQAACKPACCRVRRIPTPNGGFSGSLQVRAGPLQVRRDGVARRGPPVVLANSAGVSKSDARLEVLLVRVVERHPAAPPSGRPESSRAASRDQVEIRLPVLTSTQGVWYSQRRSKIQSQTVGDAPVILEVKALPVERWPQVPLCRPRPSCRAGLT